MLYVNCISVNLGEWKEREKEKELIPDQKPIRGFPSMLITIGDVTLYQALGDKEHHLSFPSSLWVNVHVLIL